MIKKYKMIFYVVSVSVLGALTIWQIVSARGELISSNGKEPETELDRVKEVIDIWEKREKFSLNSIQKVIPGIERKSTPPSEEPEASPSAISR